MSSQKPEQQRETIPVPDEKTIAEAYTYLLSRMLVIRQELTDLKEPGVDYNVIKYNPLGSSDFVNPNLDVAYLEAWIAVDENTPALLEVPQITGRYYTAQLLDEWGEVIVNINDRTLLTKPYGKFLLVAPGSTVKTPDDAGRILLHSNKAKMLSRVELKDDPDGALKLQKAFKLSSLGKPEIKALPNPKFAGKTGFGDFPDALAEMDDHVGEILDAIDALKIRDKTIVVFTSDNGPEATWPWQGTSGPWRGYYFTHMEGSLRVPFIIRWPGRIPTGRVSNEIVHEVDTYTTFAKIAGAQVPQDRPIDGVDQSDFLLGKSDKSNRESFPVFVADRLEAVKWRNWKVVFYEEQRDWWSPPIKLGSPKAFNLITDPKEEYPQTGLQSSWIAGPAVKVMVDFEDSLKKYPPILPGTPDPYTPPR